MICLKTIKREIHHGGEVLQRMGCLSSYKLPDLKDSPNQYFQSHILGNSRIPVSLCFITDYCSYFFDQSMTVDCFSYPYAIKLQNKKKGSLPKNWLHKYLQVLTYRCQQDISCSTLRFVLLTFYYFLLEIIPSKIILSMIHTSGIHYSFIQVFHRPCERV